MFTDNNLLWNAVTYVGKCSSHFAHSSVLQLAMRGVTSQSNFGGTNPERHLGRRTWMRFFWGGKKYTCQPIFHIHLNHWNTEGLGSPFHQSNTSECRNPSDRHWILTGTAKRGTRIEWMGVVRKDENCYKISAHDHQPVSSGESADVNNRGAR